MMRRRSLSQNTGGGGPGHRVLTFAHLGQGRGGIDRSHGRWVSGKRVADVEVAVEEGGDLGSTLPLDQGEQAPQVLVDPGEQPG